uniref:Uncharacterized protein n=1 Tax=Leptobrachium leishanense TaxID=445787 RepID=A0A8C5WM83_9ANUR
MSSCIQQKQGPRKMSSGWDNSGASFLLSTSNLTITELMDMGFVATALSNSSPCPATFEQWDHRIRPKHGESPFLLKVSESTPLNDGAKAWLGGESMQGLNRSPLHPEGMTFELSSLIAEPQAQFNNSSIVEVFYGAKVSTPCKKEQSLETSDSLVADAQASKLQDLEMVHAAGRHKSAPPLWELSEINSAVEESTPSLDVSISDLRFQSSSDREAPMPIQASTTPRAQWAGATHKDLGHSFLQPFRYQRQLSASDIPIPTSAPTPLRSVHVSALSLDELGAE